MKKMLWMILVIFSTVCTFSADLITDKEIIRLKQIAIDNVYEKATVKSYRYLVKNGLGSGRYALEKIHSNKGKILAGLNYLTELYKHKDYSKALRETFFAELEGQVESQTIALLSYLIPPAKLYYESAKLMHAYIKAIDNASYNSNIKTMAKKMIDDQLLWADKKTRDDRILNYYVKSDFTAPNRNLVAQRGFFYEYGQKIVSKGSRKDIGWDDASWNHKSLHQQKAAVLHVVRDFLRTHVQPAHDQKVRSQNLQKEVEAKINAMKKVISDLDSAANESLISAELNRLIEEKKAALEESNAQKNKEIRKVAKPNSAKKSGDLERYRKAMEQRLAILDSISKKSDDALKGFAVKNYYKFKKNSISNYERIEKLDAEAEFAIAMNALGNSGIFNGYLSPLQKLTTSYDDALKTNNKWLEDKKAEINESTSKIEGVISILEELMSSAEGVNYVGHQSFDGSIYYKKNRLVGTLSSYINSYKSRILKNKQSLESIPEILSYISELQGKIDSYNNDIDRYNSKSEKLIASLEELQSFQRGRMDNLNALSRERARWEKVVESVYDNYKQLCSQESIPFYFNTEYLNLKKYDIEFLETSYDRYFSSLFYSYTRDMDQNEVLQIELKDIKIVRFPEIFKTMKYPLYQNRPYFMPQNEVDKERADFEQRVKDLEKSGKPELANIKKYYAEWTKAKKILNEYRVAYLNERDMSFTEAITALNKGEFKEIQFKNIEKKWFAAITAFDKKLKKQKTKTTQIDKNEVDRFFLERSRRWSNDMGGIGRRQEDLLIDSRQASRYFPIYLATDIGKAKTIFLYLSGRIADSDLWHSETEGIFMRRIHNRYRSSINKQFSTESKMYFEIKKIMTKLEKELSRKFAYMEQLLENVDSVNKDAPLDEIINGRLDSDNDGIPDNIELAVGTDPVNGDDGSITMVVGTATISTIGGFSIASGVSERGGGAGQFYWSGSYIESANGWADITATDIIPSSGYGNTNITVLTTGKKYALYWNGGYYGKIEILSLSGTTLSIKYWYNSAGGIF